MTGIRLPLFHFPLFRQFTCCFFISPFAGISPAAFSYLISCAPAVIIAVSSLCFRTLIFHLNQQTFKLHLFPVPAVNRRLLRGTVSLTIYRIDDRRPRIMLMRNHNVREFQMNTPTHRTLVSPQNKCIHRTIRKNHLPPLAVTDLHLSTALRASRNA